MQSYKRKITYFYQYHNGNIGTTAGFLKLEIRGDKVKIIINIQEPPGLPYNGASLYFYHEAGDHLAALKVDRIESINGILTYHNRTNWQQLFDTGRDLYTFDGVAVVYNDSHYYIGDFQDKNRKDYELVLKGKRQETAKNQGVEIQYTAGNRMEENRPVVTDKEQTVIEDLAGQNDYKAVPTEGLGAHVKFENISNPEENVKLENVGTPEEKREFENIKNQEVNIKSPDIGEPEEYIDFEILRGAKEHDKLDTNSNGNMVYAESKKDVYEKCENCPYHKRRMEQQEQEDAFEKMLAEYPKLPMYGATELFNCVRIHPKDIGKLDMRNWKLGVNSFLTHGFYTYQYLLLGKMRFDDGSERPIIGVPGVFSNREKYLANMFGFEQFIPIKKTGIKTGEFGYWIVEISPYL